MATSSREAKVCNAEVGKKSTECAAPTETGSCTSATKDETKSKIDIKPGRMVHAKG